MIDPKGRKKELSCLSFDFGSDILYLSLYFYLFVFPDFFIPEFRGKTYMVQP